MSRLIKSARGAPYDGAVELPRRKRSLGVSPRRGPTRSLAAWLLGLIYIPFGVLHLAAPHGFLAIMPPQIPAPLDVVLFTGACEIAGGLGLIIPLTRKLAGAMLAIYAVCVWPANIYHALAHVHAPPLPDSWWYHGPRLAFQLVLIWWPLYAAELIDWPFGKRRGL